MACTRYITQIQEMVDGTLGAIRRAELEMHLDQCDDCRALLDDLRRIDDAATSLDELRPPDRVWLHVAGRLRQEGRVTDSAASSSPRASTWLRAGPSTWLRPGRSRAALLALAAALMIAVGASLMLLWPRGGSTPPPAQAGATAPPSGNPTAAASVEDVENELRQAEQHYESAIARLEQITNSDQSMDPQVAATLKKNVQVIDQAIAESRAALRSEPTSAPARGALFEALRQKVTMLQDTIALMNEMRKGNSAGAAQVLNKS